MPTPTTAMPKTAREILEEFNEKFLSPYKVPPIVDGKGNEYMPKEYINWNELNAFFLSAMRAAVESVQEPYHKLPKDLKDMDAHLIITGWNAHKDKVDERTRRFFNDDPTSPPTTKPE